MNYNFIKYNLFRGKRKKTSKESESESESDSESKSESDSESEKAIYNDDNDDEDELLLKRTENFNFEDWLRGWEVKSKLIDSYSSREIESTTFPKLLKNVELHKYQLDAIHWMKIRCHYFMQSCILADDMGLGKTLQSIGLIASIWEDKILKDVKDQIINGYPPSNFQEQNNTPGIFLIVVPKNLLKNQWLPEFKKFSDYLYNKIVVFHQDDTKIDKDDPNKKTKDLMQKYFYEHLMGEKIIWNGKSWKKLKTVTLEQKKQAYLSSYFDFDTQIEEGEIFELNWTDAKLHKDYKICYFTTEDITNYFEQIPFIIEESEKSIPSRLKKESIIVLTTKDTLGLTNNENQKKRVNFLRNQPKHLIIFDEIHKLGFGKTHKSIKKIGHKGEKDLMSNLRLKKKREKLNQNSLIDNGVPRICLTGTPISNNIYELWYLLQFLVPGEVSINGTERAFDEWLGLKPSMSQSAINNFIIPPHKETLLKTAIGTLMKRRNNQQVRTMFVPELKDMVHKFIFIEPSESPLDKIGFDGLTQKTLLDTINLKYAYKKAEKLKDFNEFTTLQDFEALEFLDTEDNQKVVKNFQENDESLFPSIEIKIKLEKKEGITNWEEQKKELESSNEYEFVLLEGITIKESNSITFDNLYELVKHMKRIKAHTINNIVVKEDNKFYYVDEVEFIRKPLQDSKLYGLAWYRIEYKNDGDENCSFNMDKIARIIGINKSEITCINTNENKFGIDIQDHIILISKHIYISPFLWRKLFDAKIIKKVIFHHNNKFYAAHTTNVTKMKMNYHNEAKDFFLPAPHIRYFEKIHYRRALFHPIIVGKKEKFADEIGKDKIHAYTEASSKFKYLLEMLKELVNNRKQKVIVFVEQYVYGIARIKEILDHNHIKSSIISGETSENDDEETLNNFKYKDVHVLIASKKKAAEGLNLTQASTVIILDVSGNPQQDLQAIARSWRQGQSKVVLVLCLIMKYTRSPDYFQAIASQNRFIQANEILKLSETDLEGAFEIKSNEIEEVSFLQDMTEDTITIEKVINIIQEHKY